MNKKVILHRKLSCNSEILELWYTFQVHRVMPVTSLMAVHIHLIMKRQHCGKNQSSFSAFKQCKALSPDKIKKSNVLISKLCATCHSLKLICDLHTCVAFLRCYTSIGKIHCFTVCSGSSCKCDSAPSICSGNEIFSQTIDSIIFKKKLVR